MSYDWVNEENHEDIQENLKFLKGDQTISTRTSDCFRKKLDKKEKNIIYVL